MGLFYEDYSLGQEWITQARTITEADIVTFCGLSGDFNPLHSDEEYSRQNLFGTRVAHGPLVLSVAVGLMSQLNLINGTAIGLLSLNWDFVRPVKPGDTIYAIVTTDEMRRTRSGHGVVTLKFDVRNQTEGTVQTGRAALMMQARDPQPRS